MSIDDDPHTGWASTVRTNKTVYCVNAVIRGNRRLTIREIADELNLSFGTCQAMLKQDLGMKRVSAKQNLFPGFSHTIRQNTVDSVPRTAATCRKLRQLLAKHYHKGWIMDLWL
jgi:hypothetical protein